MQHFQEINQKKSIFKTESDKIEELTDAIVTKTVHSIVGPTWPVPDITACLEDIVRNGAKRMVKKLRMLAKVVEDMKEDGRYILEVY